MEKYSFFVGIDISKGHLDFCIRNSSVRLGFNRVPNDPGGIKEAIKWMRSFEGFRVKECLACLEHTGIYGLTVLEPCIAWTLRFGWRLLLASRMGLAA